MRIAERLRLDYWIEPMLSLTAFVVFVLTRSDGPYPGTPATLTAQAVGLTPRLSPDHPLWFSLAGLLCRVPGAASGTGLAVFSAVCGAAAVYLMYQVVAGPVYTILWSDGQDASLIAAASRLAGAAACLSLLFCVPFWLVSNRAHMASFHVFLLVAAAWLLCLYGWTGRLRCLCWFAFLYGLGLVESATFILFAPVAGVALVMLMLSRGHWRRGTAGLLVLWGVVGIAFLFVAAAQFYRSSSYELLGFSGYPQVLRVILRDHYVRIVGSLPREGWLIIVCVIGIPWALILATARTSLTEHDWSQLILHLVMTGLVGGVLLNVPFAPWAMLGLERLVVTPYVLTAFVFGYLVAYWYALLSEVRRRRTEGGMWDIRSARLTWNAQAAVAWLCLAVLSGVLVAAPLRNVRAADARAARVVNQYAEEVVRALEGRRWLVTSGGLDENLLLAAKRLRVPLRTINLSAGGNPFYLAYIETQMETAPLRNLTRIGLLPMLTEWFTTDVDIENKAAVLSFPDLWYQADRIAVPNKLVFLGVSETSRLDADTLLYEHEAFWNQFVPVLTNGYPDAASMYSFRKEALRHASLVANNLGVVLDDLERRDLAACAYARAREVNPRNMSALLNLWAGYGNGAVTKKTNAISAEVISALGKVEAPPDAWSLARRHGYVRTPEAYAALGRTWALSGQRGLSMASLNRALHLEQSLGREDVQRARSLGRLLQRQTGQGPDVLHEVLVQDPLNRRALLALARGALRSGDREASMEWLRRAEHIGVDDGQMSLAWASVYSALGEHEKARNVLDALVGEFPDVLEAWAMLGGVALEQGDGSATRKCLQKIETLEGRQGYYGLALRALISLRQRDLGVARDLFDRALRMRPGDRELLERLLRLDYLLGARPTTMDHVRDLLTVDADNAFGWYILGSLQIRESEYDLAEDSLRRSLAGRRTAETLNDLAWVLQEAQEYEEAEVLVREALAVNGELAAAWDTLGLVLMKSGRLGEAEEALAKAVSLSPQNPALEAHLEQISARAVRAEDPGSDH